MAEKGEDRYSALTLGQLIVEAVKVCSNFHVTEGSEQAEALAKISQAIDARQEDSYESLRRLATDNAGG